MKLSTAHDVARHAGVSQATVSRVFQKPESVSEKTRIRVLDAARILAYRPNAHARGLITNRTNLVGLFFPDTDYPLHMPLVQVVSEYLRKKGFTSVLIPRSRSTSNSGSCSTVNVLEYRVDGIISFSDDFLPELYEECEALQIPIVQFGRLDHEDSCKWVIGNNYKAGAQAADLMIDQGAENLCYLTGEVRSYTDQQRYLGFSSRVQKRIGKTLHPTILHYDYVMSYKIMSDGWSSHIGDAYLCATDIIAMALIDFIDAQADPIWKKKFQLIGFDNLPQADWHRYQISTFDQQLKNQAAQAIDLLLSEIRKPSNENNNILIDVKFIKRKTWRL